MTRKTTAIIDLNALVNNFKLLQQHNVNGNTLAVIKANAYGHGAIEVARALEHDASCVAVAFVDEAKCLREQGSKQEIVVLEGAYNESETRWALANDIILVAHRTAQLQWLSENTNIAARLWLKVDTGMHRLGFMPDELANVFEQFNHLFNQETVIFSHLACADEPENQHTKDQIQRLNAILKQYAFPSSMANSAGIVQWASSHGAWNRAGIALYGGQSSQLPLDIGLQPVMTLSAPIIALRNIDAGECVGYGASWQAERPSTIATVAIGYADGYPRHAPSGTPAWCKGQHIPLVGRVSMDMLTFDVTDHAQVAVGDQVELWGRNVSVAEVAARAGTIDYELLTRVSERVPREYVG
ncbi:alanine racemase [Alteromonas flava]|uniref:alanine racemase n=1 Tax=Alteromonas flava TaxID=2048003 RepID=UPI000C286EDD|nr:alanine racemase [Alteromonas flava]